MSIETAIFTLLTADATVTASIGTRCYPEEFPEGCAWPAILYELPETQSDPTMDTAGVPLAKLRVSCYAESLPSARALGDAVMNVLRDFSGTAGGTKILSCTQSEDKNGWDYEKSEAGVYVREITFEVFFRA